MQTPKIEIGKVYGNAALNAFSFMEVAPLFKIECAYYTPINQSIFINISFIKFFTEI